MEPDQLQNWIAWHLLRGESLPDIRAEFETRFGSLTTSDWNAVVEYSRISVEVGRRAMRLGPNDPLSRALRQWVPPADTVAVSGTVRFTKLDGTEQFATIYAEVAWSDTMTDAIAAILESANRLMDDTGGTVQEVELIPILFNPLPPGV